jgi:hypothetical protein
MPKPGRREFNKARWCNSDLNLRLPPLVARSDYSPPSSRDSGFTS